MYVAATSCHRVLKITPDGQVTSILKSERPWSPTGVAVSGEDIYVLEYTNANGPAEAGARVSGKLLETKSQRGHGRRLTCIRPSVP